MFVLKVLVSVCILTLSMIKNTWMDNLNTDDCTIASHREYDTGFVIEKLFFYKTKIPPRVRRICLQGIERNV